MIKSSEQIEEETLAFNRRTRKILNWTTLAWCIVLVVFCILAFLRIKPVSIETAVAVVMISVACGFLNHKIP